jgi:hypothetical protein
MPDNVLIPLPSFQLPDDFPWRVGFVSLVNDQLRRLRATGHFLPPRFFGYYFQNGAPVGVGGSWTVSLVPSRPMTLVTSKLDRLTKGLYSIASTSAGSVPDFMLIHDRCGGSCWLWSFDEGLRFVEAVEPVVGGWNDAETPRLFGP